ncbi:MAG TPA: anti-sigma factor, partial [Candidatus Tenderia electrophaga]|nr:anti-sigma factor [Candidatus Tenderia electrophaga]
MAETIMKEEISALMDGEVDEQEMQRSLRDMRNDPEQRDCWEQYHIIGDALRNNLPPTLNRDFVNNVSQAIAKE